MITLYQYEISPFCDKVRRALTLKGLNHEIIEILPSARNKYNRISPTGKFPALDHDGTIVIDSTEILRYLETLAPEPPLYPADPRAHALTVLLEDWADESLYFYDLTMRNWPHNRAWFVADLLRHENPFVRKLLGALIPGALLKIAKAQGIGRKDPVVVTRDLCQLYDAAAALLRKSRWLTGDTITAADLAVFAMMFVIRRTTEGEAALAARPELLAWFDAVDVATKPRMA